MSGRIWGGVSAGIGVVILAVLVVYGTEYGTWVDEAGPLDPGPPTFILPFVIGALGLVLLVGGSVIAIVGARGSARTASSQG
jgi:hypothetical protein